eukprot:TRINITY_DN54568_c0_g2_i1.p1 TRINITY_DN54568_c0_g2~~TRINITY_DN54568_c0_g2_i1.p1  ORF type:complete len:328 (-),score=47.88 TRINITY_DN54568_c0_g2_i1:85-1068(-)
MNFLSDTDDVGIGFASRQAAAKYDASQFRNTAGPIESWGWAEDVRDTPYSVSPAGQVSSVASAWSSVQSSPVQPPPSLGATGTGLECVEEVASEDMKSPGGSLSRPDVVGSVSADRPCTRRIRCTSRALKNRNEITLPGQTEAAERVAMQRGRRVVYVDHHHVHHHHHFYRPSDWLRGEPVPEDAQRLREYNAQADVETAHGLAHSRKDMKQRQQRSQGFSSPNQSTSAWASTSDDAAFSAEVLVCQDPEWRSPGMMYGSHRGASGSGGKRGHSSGSQRRGGSGSGADMPMADYFSLISRLKPEGRLKFSPYALPHSARAQREQTED